MIRRANMVTDAREKLGDESMDLLIIFHQVSGQNSNSLTNSGPEGNGAQPAAKGGPPDWTFFFETLTLKSLVEPAQSRRAAPTRALCAVCCVLCAGEVLGWACWAGSAGLLCC
ncbi:unnamed protein product [Ectocarpus sp. 6 AP-2014]